MAFTDYSKKMWDWLTGGDATLVPNVQLAGSNVGKKVSTNFTRADAADAYSAGDVISDSTTTPHYLTFASVGVAGQTICINSSRIIANKASTNLAAPVTTFRLHLFSSAPTAIADNAALTTLAEADAAPGKYLGHITMSAPIDIGYNWASQDDNINKFVTLVGTALYGILETVSGFTPTASAVKTIDLFYTLM